MKQMTLGQLPGVLNFTKIRCGILKSAYFVNAAAISFR